MNKKIIFAILVMYLLFTLASPIVFAEQESEQTQSSGIFATKISFDFTKNLTDEPINPSETQEVDINVKFKLDIGSFAKWFFFKRRIGRLLMFGPSYILKIKPLPKSNLNISISECPTWCSAKIDTALFEFSFDNIYSNKESSVEKTVKLEYTINENATALEKDDIVIQAEFKGVGAINAITNTTKIGVTAAYIPNILIEAEAELTIPPLQNTTVPINITNNGNGDSTILINYMTPENWTATFDPEILTLGLNETKQIILTINPTKEFTNQTINFSFIPKYIEGLYEGTPVYLSINFINDGSLNKGIGNDVLVVGIIILIIVILLVVTILFLRKKKE